MLGISRHTLDMENHSATPAEMKQAFALRLRHPQNQKKCYETDGDMIS
jgi:hypothetical protein